MWGVLMCMYVFRGGGGEGSVVEGKCVSVGEEVEEERVERCCGVCMRVLE